MKLKLSFPKFNKKNQIAIALLVIKTFLGSSGIITVNDYVDTAFAVVAAILFMVSIIEKKYSIKVLLVYIVIILMAFYSTVQIGNVGWLITIITCLAIQKEDINKVIRYIYQWEVIMFVFTVFLGIIFAIAGQHSLISSISDALRMNMGFSHPNIFALYLMNIMAMWIWINYSTIKTRQVLGIIAIEIVSYMMSSSDGALIATLLLCIMVLWTKKVNNGRGLLKFVAQIITPVCALFSWGTAVLYLKGYWFVIALDSFFSSRIKLSAYAWNEFGVTLFGKDLSDFNIAWDSTWNLNSFTFDNIYSYFISNIGLIWLIAICVMFWLLARRKDTKINLFIVFWAVFGIAEVHGINCYQLFPLILVTTLLQKNEYQVRTEYQEVKNPKAI